MKKILAQLPHQIDAALAEASLKTEKFHQLLRWLFAAFFLFAALWSWGDETASASVYFGLSVLWALAALIFGLRQNTNLQNGNLLPYLVDFGIVTLGLILCAWQEIFNAKGFIIFLCYFPLLALLSLRNKALLIIQITTALLFAYLVISLFTIGSLSLLRVSLLGIMGIVALLLVRKPKTEMIKSVSPLIEQAYAAGALEKEIELTALIHAQFMPPVQYETSGLYATYKHGVGTHTSGDFYQIYPHQDGAIILLADLPGAGLQAAYTVSQLHQQISGIVAQHDNIAAIAQSLNQLIWQHFQGAKPMTAILAQWQGTNLHYVNAGHLPAIKISKREISRLFVNNADAFGADEAAQFRAEVIDFQRGDLLILYTDGAYAGLADNPSKGADEMERMTHEFSSGEVNTICHRLFDCGQPEFSRAPDDSTVVVIRRQE